MKRETISAALNLLDERHIRATERFDPGLSGDPPERIEPMKVKRIFTFVLAAALLLALGAAAYAISGIHAARQQEIRNDLQIAASGTDSYQEDALPEEDADGIVLLSAISDGYWRRICVTGSPITEEELAAWPGELSFGLSLQESDLFIFAAPELPPDLTLSGKEEIQKAVRDYAYDSESQTLTLECITDAASLREAMAGQDSIMLRLASYRQGEKVRDLGSFVFTPTEAEMRHFDFGSVPCRDEESGREVALVSLDLSPISAVWKFRSEDFVHLFEAEQYPESEPYLNLCDDACWDTELVLADGSRFRTGGFLSAPVEDGLICCRCDWKSALDIQAVEQILLSDQVLWEAK